MPEILHTEFSRESLEALTYQTPFFLFSRKRIEHNLREFKKYFHRATVYYAMKANSELELLQLLFDLGCGFEVASAYELDMLKKLSVPSEKILYGTSVKLASHIRQFFDYGVNRFAFDSFPELEKIASIAPSSYVYARIRVNDTGSVYRFSEKFGAEKEDVVPLLRRAKELGLHPYGISFHVGSQASNLMAWVNALDSVHEIMEHLKKVGIEIEIINLGGGYPCKYASSDHDFSLKEIADCTLKRYKKLPYEPKLILEPGRGMVADTGIVVASVIARIQRRESTWLFLDAGVYNALFEAMAYQGAVRYAVTSMRPTHDSGEALFALAGPTGDSADVITREAVLPKDIDIGDKLIFHDSGAYNTITAVPFNGFPKPPVWFV